MTDFKILSGKEALEYWKAEAIRRDVITNNRGFNSFQDWEVVTIVGSYEKAFGLARAREFINKCQETQKSIGSKNNITFNRSVVKTLAREDEINSKNE